MAISPFAGAGLSQFGQEMAHSDSKDGIGAFLAAYGLQKSGAEEWLNKTLQPAGIGFSGGKLHMIKPPEKPDVNPYLNTGMPASQPYAMPPNMSMDQEAVPHQDGIDFIKEAQNG